MCGVSHLVQLHTTAASVPPLDLLLERLQSAVGLALGHAADQSAAHERPDGTERCPELVLIVEARPRAGFAQQIFGVSARARRSAALPNGAARLLAVDQLPV